MVSSKLFHNGSYIKVDMKIMLRKEVYMGFLFNNTVLNGAAKNSGYSFKAREGQ
jgi:hypothetical protein